MTVMFCTVGGYEVRSGWATGGLDRFQTERLRARPARPAARSTARTSTSSAGGQVDRQDLDQLGRRPAARSCWHGRQEPRRSVEAKVLEGVGGIRGITFRVPDVLVA